MNTDPLQYRVVPRGHDVCTVCDQIVRQLHEPRLLTRPSLRTHGPRGNRCPGSHQPGQPWIEASHLPTWDQLTDVDKGRALMFVWKCHWERSYAYARDNYPATYADHPMLLALQRSERCRHATAVCRGDVDRQSVPSTYQAVLGRIGEAEFDRLYNLALDSERQRPARRHLVAVSDAD